MKERLLNNLGLKLLSVAVAFLIWITIINVIDPSSPKPIYGVPVNLVNTETLSELGYTFDVIEGNSISIVVDGPISKTDNLTTSDFYAWADLSTISPLSDYVDIDVICTKSNISSDDIKITLKTSAVKLSIENRETITLDVGAVFSGNPAAGHAVGDYDVSPMSIKITGAESAIEKISYVVAEYDVEGASLDITDNVPLKVYDEDGNKLDTSNLVLSKDTVKLKIPILAQKTVPVNYAYTGTTRDGYKISELTSTINEVTIAGTTAVLSGISSIDIPAELIDVSDLYGVKVIPIRLSHYIPSNVKVMSEVVAEVTVDVEQTTTKAFNIATKNISILNANEQYDYAFILDNVSVTYSGLKSDLNNINPDEIKASVDVAGFTQGSKIVKLYVGNINNCASVGEYMMTIVINKK